MRIIILLSIVLSFLHPSVIHIPEQFPLIQQGINASVTGDTILVQPGTYYENINISGHDITLASLFITTGDRSYISQTVIDGNQNDRVILIANSGDQTPKLIGFKVTNGYVTNNDGGGILIHNASPVLRSLIVSSNEARRTSGTVKGGGIACRDGSNPTITEVLVADNYAGPYSSKGGGISITDNSAPVLINVKVVNNSITMSSAGHGSGIYIENSSPMINGIEVSTNEGGVGAGIYVTQNSSLLLSNFHISDNSALSTDGCGIHLGGESFLQMQHGEISGNLMSHNMSKGAGIFVYENSVADLFDVSIHNNTINIEAPVQIDGAGIYCRSSQLYCENVSIADNQIITLRGGGNGAGLAIYNNSQVYLSDVEVIGNEVVITEEEGGGTGVGLHLIGSYCEIDRTVFAENRVTGELATNEGLAINLSYSNLLMTNTTLVDQVDANLNTGSIHLNSGELVLINSIIWGNAGQTIVCDPIPFVSTITVAFSDIEDGMAGIVNNGVSEIVWYNGNLDAHPLIADGIGYLLLPDSPCIDTGIQLFIMNGDTLLHIPEEDILGEGPDMGARESEISYIPGCTDPDALNYNPEATQDDASCFYCPWGVLEVPSQFSSIQEAVDAACDGDTILIAPGAYQENLVVENKPVTIGSFFMVNGDTESISNTLIDGGSNGSVITVISTDYPGVSIKGLTLTNGSGRLIDNQHTAGGALFAAGADSISLSFVHIRDNSADYGSGIYNAYSNMNAEHVYLLNNTSGQQSGSMHIIGKQCTIINNTIAGNSGSGLQLYHTSAMVRNSIFWNNTLSAITSISNSDLDLSYSLVQGGEGPLLLNNEITLTGSVGNIDTDPLLMSDITGQLKLQPGSPCIDAGDPDLDADGILWRLDTDDQDPDFSRMDMGWMNFDRSEIARQCVELSIGRIDQHSFQIRMDNCVDIYGVQFDVSGEIEITVPGGLPDLDGWIIMTNGTTVMIFHAEWDSFAPGSHVICELDYHLTNNPADSTEFCLVNPIASGIDGVSVPVHAEDCVVIPGECQEMGDVNSDGLLDIIDILIIVMCLVEDLDCECTDINDNGSLDIGDIILYVEEILGG